MARQGWNRRRHVVSVTIVATLASVVLIKLLRQNEAALVPRVAQKISGEFPSLNLSSNTSLESPEAAWLMTFPNSGTTYTLKLIQQYTNTTTATNYGNEQGVSGTSIPIRDDLSHGPFFRRPTWHRPSQYILTKTHCGGTSMDPEPERYVETVRSFEIACRSGNRIVNGTKEHVTYDMSIPKRAVHLIRNPFDNIVARLHHSEKSWAHHEEKADRLKWFNSSREGFRAWCHMLDSRATTKEENSRFFDEEVLQLAEEIPCHAEFLRWTWWHNLAVEVTQHHNLPVHNMYYEDYATSFQQTVEDLFEFLDLKPATGAQPLQFILGKHYESYYDPREIANARRLVSIVATPETWSLVRRYFS